MSLTKFNYSRPRRVGLMTSGLGTGKSLTFLLQCTWRCYERTLNRALSGKSHAVPPPTKKNLPKTILSLRWTIKASSILTDSNFLPCIVYGSYSTGRVTMRPRLFRPRTFFFWDHTSHGLCVPPYYPSLTRGGGLRRSSLIIFIYVVRVLLS